MKKQNNIEFNCEHKDMIPLFMCADCREIFREVGDGYEEVSIVQEKKKGKILMENILKTLKFG